MKPLAFGSNIGGDRSAPRALTCEAAGVSGKGRLRDWRHKLFRRDPERSVRRASDALRIALAAAVFVALALHAGDETAAERTLVRLVGALPAGLRIPLDGIYSLAVLWAVALAVAALLVGRRWRLARDIGIAAVVAWASARLLGAALQGIGLGDSLDAVTQAGSSPHFPLTRVAIVTAAVIVASPHLTRPVRRVGQVVIGLLAVRRPVSRDRVARRPARCSRPGLGRRRAGSPRLRRSDGSTLRGRRARRAPPARGRRQRTHPREHQPAGRTAYTGRDTVGRLHVTVLGRDEMDAQLLARAWRWAAYRHQSPIFFVTRRQQVEHEAYALLRATAGGARVPGLIAAGTATDRIALVAIRSVDGLRLADADAALSDATLRALWVNVARLHSAGIADGRLTASAVVIAPDGPTIVGFAAATTTPDDRRRTADVAELLAATSAIVGIERAVAAANEIGPDALASALPLLQAAALTSVTRDALGDSSARDETLTTLRAETARVARTETPELAKLAASASRP